jgi:putative transposase
VTPSQRHRGEDKKVMEQRNDVYKAARENNLSRWSGDTRNWSWIDSVDLNPRRTENVEKKAA